MKPYPMRRARQALSDAACAAVLKRATSGVLALSEKDGTPYAVPLSFVDDGNALYFHCAKEGRKLDVIAQNPRAAFCAVGRDDVRPEAFTTRYESVTVFGKISIVKTTPKSAVRLCYCAINMHPNPPRRTARRSFRSIGMPCVCSNFQKMP